MRWRDVEMEGCQPERRDGGNEGVLMQIKEMVVTDSADRRGEEGGETEASMKSRGREPSRRSQHVCLFYRRI